MPILTKVESKGRGGRLFLAGVIILLMIGGFAMAYPFMLMLSGAMRSEMDSADMGPVPAYLQDDEELVQKFLETKYEYSPPLMNVFRQTQNYEFRDAEITKSENQQAAEDLKKFMNQVEMPDHWQMLGGTDIENHVSCVKQRRLVDKIRERYDDDLAAYNAEVGAPVRNWGQLHLPLPRWGEYRTNREINPLWEAYIDLMWESPVAYRALTNLTGIFLDRVIYPEYAMEEVEEFAETHDLDIDGFHEFRLPRRVPCEQDQPQLREKWLDFVVGDNVNLSFVRVDVSDTDYQEFLKDRFDEDLELLNLRMDADYESFQEPVLPEDHEWIPEQRREIYRAFVHQSAPEKLRLVGPEFAWREFLEDKYDGDSEAAADAHGRNAESVESWKDFHIAYPLRMLETQYVLDNSGALRWRYALRNFNVVAREMFLQGRPFLNSIIYVTLALIATLTIMPLAAYSMSRFNPPGTWKFIFLFVAPMAFPPMTDMIPRFLMIRELGLINTYFALILPLTTQGMLIFLLKGFFDALPQDLYDAALIDGASETRIFFTITMAMSTPILAVVALNTFNAAWRQFMYPLIVAPAEEMHVLAVWLQQFQLNASQPAVFTSVLLASIPSLLIFLFAQRTIMRGIAVPSEK